MFRCQVDRSHDGIRCEQGFTVLELLVVLAIAAIALAVVSPVMTSGREVAELRHAASSTLSLLRHSRSEAIAQNREQVLVFDLARRRISQPATGRSLTLGSTTKMTLVTLASEAAGAMRGTLRFYPDGSSSGGRVILSNGPQRVRLDVDWLTGIVRQSSGGGDANSR